MSLCGYRLGKSMSLYQVNTTNHKCVPNLIGQIPHSEGYQVGTHLKLPVLAMFWKQRARELLACDEPHRLRSHRHEKVSSQCYPDP